MVVGRQKEFHIITYTHTYIHIHALLLVSRISSLGHVVARFCFGRANTLVQSLCVYTCDNLKTFACFLYHREEKY